MPVKGRGNVRRESDGSLRWSGRPFQTVPPSAENVRSGDLKFAAAGATVWNSLLVRGATKVTTSEDRSARRLTPNGASEYIHSRLQDMAAPVHQAP